MVLKFLRKDGSCWTFSCVFKIREILEFGENTFLFGKIYGIRVSDSDREIGEIRSNSFNREQQDWGQNWEFQLFT